MCKLLIFHPTIAPYRIDFFNDLSRAFHTRVCLKYWNLREQTFDYDKIYSKFVFRPIYLKERFDSWGRSFCSGYWKNLNEFQPDVVLTEEFGIGTMLVLMHRFFKRKKYKVITLCDDSYDMVSAKNDFSWLHRIARNLFAPRLDDIIVVEPKTEQWYRSNFGKGFCFPIIKDEEKARMEFLQVADWRSNLLDKCSLNGKNIFLFVGRLVALKNVSTILRAFSTLNQRENILVIIGDGPEKEPLRILSEELKINVLFTGRLEGDELNVWYTMATTLVLASYREAFGAVTNEALLAGCYVLVSNKAGSACLVDEGINGYTFNPMNERELAAKMEKIVNLPKDNPIKGLRKNKMLLSYQKCMEGLVGHLKQFLNE